MAVESVALFDWHRVFIGNLTWLYIFEIAFRTAFLFIFAIVMLRLLGKRAGKQMTAFEMVIVVALGSAAGDPMFYPEVPLLWGMTVITILILGHRLLTQISFHSSWFENKAQGAPQMLVEDGVVVEEEFQDSRLTREELRMKLRQQGIQQLGEVEKAYLEPSGNLSVWQRQDAPPGLSTRPYDTADAPEQFPAGTTTSAGTYACAACGTTITLEKKGALPPCPRYGHQKWTRAEQ